MFLAAVLTAAIFYNAILFRSASFVLLGYACTALLLGSCIFLAYRVRTLHCRITFPVSIAECGRPLAARIFIENTSFLPCMKFKCLLEQKNRFLNKKRRKWLRGGMAAAGSSSFDYSVVINNYGSYELRLKKIRVYDLTGLFYADKRLSCSGSVQVLPAMQEIGVHLSEAARNFLGESDCYDEYRPGDDHSELFQVRPFQNGDKIQSVHWKLSAKSGELLVKENSFPKACPAVFLLEYQSGKQKTAEKANAYLVILASIAFSMLDAGCPFYAAWYSSSRRDAVRVRVDGEESLFLFLSSYLEEPFQEQGTLAETYREKYRGENYLYLLHFNEKLELWKNEDKIVQFQEKDWKETLSGLEIIL